MGLHHLLQLSWLQACSPVQLKIPDRESIEGCLQVSLLSWHLQATLLHIKQVRQLLLLFHQEANSGHNHCGMRLRRILARLPYQPGVNAGIVVTHPFDTY